jgi:NADH-quinone oxidoreductase subunit N
MYFDAPQDNAPISAPLDMRILLSVNAAALLVVGLMPQLLMAICGYAVTVSLQA